MKREILFVCPHWHQSGNVGLLRAQRMIRWLSENDYYVIVLAAGSSTYRSTTDFGHIHTVQDPLGIYIEKRKQKGTKESEQAGRKPNPWRRLLGYALFTPDLQIAWAIRCYLNPDIRKISEDADVILSSSPPESAHILAGWLTRLSGTPFVMDMRDGWLDEPMKPLLRASAMQRLRERRLERRSLSLARFVLVSSSTWRDYLIARYPSFADKIVVHTNGYPLLSQQETSQAIGSQDPQGFVGKPVAKMGALRMLHAGRIQSSRPERKVDSLLDPIFTMLSTSGYNGELIFLGALEKDEENEIAEWSTRFSEIGSTLKRVPQVPHSQVHTHIQSSDVLLLLSPSMASIPAKFFDYLASGKPVVCFTKDGSAVYRAIESIPQCHFIDTDNPDLTSLHSFFQAVISRNLPRVIPDIYQDFTLKQSFMKILEEVHIR